MHGKWIDCKSAILRQEIEQDPVLAAQLAAKKEARRSPSPKKPSPPKIKKSSPNRVIDHEIIENHQQEKLGKFIPQQTYKQPEYPYEGPDQDYPYDYQGVKEGTYFSPSSYQWNNRYYDQHPYPRSYRHNPQRENPRYRQNPPPPPREYIQPIMPNQRVSPTNRYAYGQPAFTFGFYPPSHEMPMMPPQPIYAPMPAYPPSTSFRPPSPVRGPPGPMGVPVIQDFSPPRERYLTDFNEDSEDQLDFREVTKKQTNQVSSPLQQPPDQAIKLNLNFKPDEEEDPTLVKPQETSKTLSPDRKAYNLFEGNKETEVFDRPPGLMNRYIGMIGSRVAEVNSSRNSPRQVEYKKYYSPTQKHRGEVVAKLFEKAITLKPQQTDKTTDKFAK